MSQQGPAAPERFDRYVPRRDISAVPPQGGYVAKRCPQRVEYDVFPPADVEPLDPPVGVRLRMDDGIAFEAEVFAELVALHPDAVVVDQSQPAPEQQAETSAAMAAGAELILGGWLPTDLVGRRVGRPDLLVRAEHRADGNWAYLPADVKHHLTLRSEPPKEDVPGACTSSLAALSFTASTIADDRVARSSTDDLLQLAHYRRMLATTHHASADVIGAIIGKERELVWHRLDAPVVRQLWDGTAEAREAALQRYDFEFSFRLDVIAAAAEGESLVEPVLVGECSSCPWRGRCIPEIEAADSTSLLPGFGYKQWHAMRRVGITTRAALAQADPADEALQDAFAQVGTPKALADAIHGARVVTGGGLPQLRDGIARLIVPSADIEIDIDMENASDGTVYLWGAWVDDAYHSFTSWSTPSAEVDAEVFVGFWDWLSEQRREAAEADRTVAIYCWSQQAEAGALARGAAAAAEVLGRTEVADEVAELLASRQWVDLLEVFRTQLITGRGNGLKVVAALAGFAWRDEDPNGQDSMAWHATAVGRPGDASPPAEAYAARARLLAYNEDDVRATAAVRTWMRALPSTAPTTTPAS